MNNYSKEKNQIKWIEDKIDKALDPHDPVNFYYNLKLLWRCSNEFDRDILIECFLFRYAILNQRTERKKETWEETERDDSQFTVAHPSITVVRG